MPNVWNHTSDGWQSGDLDAPFLEEAGVAIHRVPVAAPGEALLLVRGANRVHVNGDPVVGGARVLDDRDEILVDGRRFAFSGESPPEIVPFVPPEGTKRKTKCGVCRTAFEPDEPVVHCPRCDRAYHQATEEHEGKKCWTYRDTCAFCGHPTAMNGEAAWRPEEDDHA